MEYRLDGHDGDYYSCCSDYGSIYIHLSSNIKYPMPTMKLQCEFYYCIKEDVIHDSLVSATLSLGTLSISFKLQISLGHNRVSTTNSGHKLRWDVPIEDTNLCNLKEMSWCLRHILLGLCVDTYRQINPVALSLLFLIKIPIWFWYIFLIASKLLLTKW